ncbi:MAG: N-acetylmuramoyl-L-alanine amidase [bacterium]
MWLNRYISFNKLSFGVMNDTVEQAQAVKNKEKEEIKNTILKENNKELPKLSYEEIIQEDFPDHLYFKERTKKNQIVLHHTVSGRNVDGDINWWKQNPQRIATSIIIDWKGNIHQLFSTRYWAYHLGISASNNRALNQASIGVEIDAWGGLVKYNRKWYPARWNGKKYVANTNFKPVENVQTYSKKYRGFYGYEKYTDEQIESVRKLLVYWGNVHDIPLNYNENMWDVNGMALRGEPGIWSHTSFRADKSDVHPQPELIEMLKSLSK